MGGIVDMFAHATWALFALYWARPSMAQEAGTGYQFTMAVTSPAPIPGQPFTLTWTGGEPSEAVYIVLTYYFPNTPNQNIPYGNVDILSNAPNNGSWTYNIPSNIAPGRYSFGIGENPILLSSSSGIFTITAAQISGSPALPGPPATTNTGFQSYNGCGLPPLPDYTYTGYQPPCTTTTDGHVETLYPIVPVSDSSAFFGGAPSVVPIQSTIIISATPSSITSSMPFNSAFATGVFAQALQCPTPVTPSATKLVAGDATTLLSLVDCNAAFGSSTNSGGICHTSGYTTFSVSGTSSVCCPGAWLTTPLNAQLFCFTSIGQAAKRAGVEQRQVSSSTVDENSSNILVDLTGLVFMSAGLVTEAAIKTGSSSTMETSPTADASPTAGGSNSEASTSTATGSVASASTMKSSGLKFELWFWRTCGIAVLTMMVAHLA